MDGNKPDDLEEVDPRARRFPDSWKDAAIRILFDVAIGGVQCAGCKAVHKGRAQLRLLQADHIHPWSREGLTVWANMQLLCPPCNVKKTSSIS